jgi:hypothetical protein
VRRIGIAAIHQKSVSVGYQFKKVNVVTLQCLTDAPKGAGVIRKIKHTISLQITPLGREINYQTGIAAATVLRLAEIPQWSVRTVTVNQAKKATLEELMVSTLAMTDALAKLMIAKGLITDEEFKAQLGTERANYFAVLKRLGTRPGEPP